MERSKLGTELINQLKELINKSLSSFDFENRILFDEKWMSEALINSLKSSDPKRKVGCVIVSMDNKRIISQGYNGDEPGGSNLRKSMETGKSGFIHAEDNALIFANGSDVSDKKMYVTLSPCIECATRILINGTIKEVYYLEEYCKNGLALLNKKGVKTIKM